VAPTSQAVRFPEHDTTVTTRRTVLPLAVFAAISVVVPVAPAMKPDAEVVSTSETTCVSSLVYLGGAVDEFLWSVDVRSCGKLPNVGFAANEPLWMRDMRCVQNLLPSF